MIQVSGALVLWYVVVHSIETLWCLLHVFLFCTELNGNMYHYCATLVLILQPMIIKSLVMDDNVNLKRVSQIHDISLRVKVLGVMNS